MMTHNNTLLLKVCHIPAYHIKLQHIYSNMPLAMMDPATNVQCQYKEQTHLVTADSGMSSVSSLHLRPSQNEDLFVSP